MKMIYKRTDRNNNETRPIEAELNVLKRADGSATFSFGNSKALVAVYGPRQLYPQHLQNPEKCLLRCYYDLVSFSVSERKKPGPSRRSTEISYIMSKALTPLIKLDEFPNAVIDVYSLIVDADASTRCSAINAASMALASAGLPMTDIVSSVSVGKIGDDLFVDLTKEEEDYKYEKQGKQEKTTDIPMAFLSKTGNLSLLQLDGKISQEKLKEAIKLGREACKKITEIQIKTLKSIKED